MASLDPEDFSKRVKSKETSVIFKCKVATLIETEGNHKECMKKEWLCRVLITRLTTILATMRDKILRGR